jgi:hypothetical protein
LRKLAIISCVLIVYNCESIKIKEQVLYDKYEQQAPKENYTQVIFSEGAGTMWNSLFNCGSFEINNSISYSGKSSIKLDWNKGNCEWIGFGNSFNNWQPVDLSENRFKKALRFFVRTQSKTAKAIPIVANLEDFSGGGSYYFIDAGKYLNGLEIDTTWKEIIVPLWHFPIDPEEIDINAIKQIQFQLEGSGSFYIDEIEIIDYTKEDYAISRSLVEQMKPKGMFNQIVYRKDNFEEDVWGYKNNNCQELKEIKDSIGNMFIHWKYNADECSWAKWGINWNGWYAINLRGASETSSIYFKIRSSENSQFRVMIEDFKGHKTELFSNKNKETVAEKGWKSVEIQLKNLELKEKDFVLDQIKQIYFEGKSVGEVFIDEIKIIK